MLDAAVATEPETERMTNLASISLGSQPLVTGRSRKISHALLEQKNHTVLQQRQPILELALETLLGDRTCTGLPGREHSPKREWSNAAVPEQRRGPSRVQAVQRARAQTLRSRCILSQRNLALNMALGKE